MDNERKTSTKKGESRQKGTNEKKTSQTLLIDATKKLIKKMSSILDEAGKIVPRKGFPDKKYFGVNTVRVSLNGESTMIDILVPPQIDFDGDEKLKKVTEGELFEYTVSIISSLFGV